jgi:hypothetical protein
LDTLPFFKWCDSTWIGTSIRNVTWAFPLIETFHILALTVLLGAILMIDLRLLGVAIRNIPLSRMQRELSKYINWSLAVAICTGILLFLSEAMKCYDNSAIRPKITMLTLAIIWHYTAHRKTTLNDKPLSRTPARAAVALVSLMLWFGVGAAGRAIGFV